MQRIGRPFEPDHRSPSRRADQVGCGSPAAQQRMACLAGVIEATAIPVSATALRPKGAVIAVDMQPSPLPASTVPLQAGPSGLFAGGRVAGTSVATPGGNHAGRSAHRRLFALQRCAAKGYGRRRKRHASRAPRPGLLLYFTSNSPTSTVSLRSFSRMVTRWSCWRVVPKRVLSQSCSVVGPVTTCWRSPK